MACVISSRLVTVAERSSIVASTLLIQPRMSIDPLMIQRTMMEMVKGHVDAINTSRMVTHREPLTSRLGSGRVQAVYFVTNHFQFVIDRIIAMTQKSQDNVAQGSSHYFHPYIQDTNCSNYRCKTNLDEPNHNKERL